MFFDSYKARYLARKRKKTARIVAIVAGVAAFIALMPIAAKRDKNKGEWGIASLLLFVGSKKSEKHEGKREITIVIPGFTHAKKMLAETCKCRKEEAEPVCTDDFCPLDDDLADLAGEDTAAEPEVTITEE